MDILSFNLKGAKSSDLKAVQTELQQRRFYGDVIDGDFGTLSTAALNAVRAATNGDLAAIGLTQIGIHEVPHGSNSGSTVRMYQRETSLGGTGWYWCAALQCWLFARLQDCQPAKYGHIKRPTTASAFEFADWGRDVGGIVFTPGSLKYQPQRNDIVIYNFSHIGVMSQYIDAARFFVVEGNTNEDGSADGEEVWNHPRHIQQVKYFVRLPAAA